MLEKIRSLFARLTTASPRRDYRTGGTSQAGVYVTPDVALTVSTVYRCVTVNSNSVAQLPWRVRVPEPAGGSKIMPTNPVDYLLNKRPNLEMGAFTFRQLLVASLQLWGNGYAEIERDAAGRVAALWYIAPDRVVVDRDANRRVIYRVANDLGGETVLQASDVFHVRGLGDELVGYSAIGLARRSLGLTVATEEFGSSFFGNGAEVGTVIKHPKQIGEEAQDRLKAQMEKRRGAKNARKTLILEEGMSVERIGIPPEDAQFLETRSFQVDEICRWFGTPPHKAFKLDRATFSNIEHQGIEYGTDFVAPMAKIFEDEADYKLFGFNRQGLFTKLNLAAIMRGDSDARAKFYKAMFNMGAFSPNDILRLEDENPIGPAGDQRLVQAALIPLDKVGQNFERQNQPPPAADPAPASEEDDDDV